MLPVSAYNHEIPVCIVRTGLLKLVFDNVGRHVPSWNLYVC